MNRLKLATWAPRLLVGACVGLSCGCSMFGSNNSCNSGCGSSGGGFWSRLFGSRSNSCCCPGEVIVSGSPGCCGDGPLLGEPTGPLLTAPPMSGLPGDQVPYLPPGGGSVMPPAASVPLGPQPRLLPQPSATPIPANPSAFRR